MDTRTRWVVGTLVAVVIGLGVALIIVAADDSSDSGGPGTTTGPATDTLTEPMTTSEPTNTSSTSTTPNGGTGVPGGTTTPGAGSGGL